MVVHRWPHGLRLTAADHAACTAGHVLDAKPGRTYRVRVQYRALTGNRPQICLWQTGTDGCELAARPALGGGWTSYERFVTMDEVASGLQIVLHADVGERLRRPAVTEYRGLRIEAVDPVVQHDRVAAARRAERCELTRRASTSSRSTVASPARCWRRSSRCRTASATTTRPPSRPTCGQGATPRAARPRTRSGGAAPGLHGRHRARTSARPSLYELSMQARSVALRNPKFCLYLRGPGPLPTLPPVAVGHGWTPYGRCSPGPDAVETRLYLYGLRDLAGKQRSQVEYRGRAPAPGGEPDPIVLVRRHRRPTAAPAGHLEATEPGALRRSVAAPASGPTAVALAETAAPGWLLAASRAPASAWCRAG